MSRLRIPPRAIIEDVPQDVYDDADPGEAWVSGYEQCREDMRQQLLKIKDRINVRRLYDEETLPAYDESDRDYLQNNNYVAVELLDAILAVN